MINLHIKIFLKMRFIKNSDKNKIDEHIIKLISGTLEICKFSRLFSLDQVLLIFFT